jgi:hypothetical protein
MISLKFTYSVPIHLCFLTIDLVQHILRTAHKDQDQMDKPIKKRVAKLPSRKTVISPQVAPAATSFWMTWTSCSLKSTCLHLSLMMTCYSRPSLLINTSSPTLTQRFKMAAHSPASPSFLTTYNQCRVGKTVTHWRCAVCNENHRCQATVQQRREDFTWGPQPVIMENWELQ